MDHAPQDPALLHASVLPAEVLELLDPEPGQTLFDGTLGLGGHSRILGERLGPEGLLIGFDRDLDALEIGRASCRERV
jgi:16S rRNA (cytosine1402-N4)-methyltransferase